MVQLQLKFQNFVKSCINSVNGIVRERAVHSMYSVLGFQRNRLNNIMYCNRHIMTDSGLSNMRKALLKKSQLQSDILASDIVLLKDLIACRDGLYATGFDHEYINYMIWYCSVT